MPENQKPYLPLYQQALKALKDRANRTLMSRPLFHSMLNPQDCRAGLAIILLKSSPGIRRDARSQGASEAQPWNRAKVSTASWKDIQTEPSQELRPRGAGWMSIPALLALAICINEMRRLKKLDYDINKTSY